jgi:signal transduction histidine kinase
MTTRATIWFFLMLALSWIGAPAAAQDLIRERATFEDQRGDMSLEQVKKSTFSPAEKMISKGYTDAALWLRFKVDAPADAGALALSLLPATLDDVTLFSPQASGKHQARRLLQRATMLTVPQSNHYYYLRIKTIGSMMALSTVLTVEQARKEDIGRAIVLGAVLASFVPIMLGLLLLIALRREMLHVVFLLHLPISLGVFITRLGYLTEHVEPGVWFDSDTVHHFLMIANILTGFLFIRILLARFGLPAWGKSLFTLFFIAYTPLLALFFIQDRQLIQGISTAMGMFASAFCLLLTAAIFYRGTSMTWPIATLITAVMLVAIKTFLVLHGIMPVNQWTIHLLAFRLFFFPAIFGIILWLIDREKQEAVRVSMMKEALLQQLAEHEKERGQTRQRFMTMLMHELKTPLSIIQLAAASLGRHLPSGSGDLVRVSNINRSVDDLNTLIEHCVQADQIEDSTPLIDQKLFCLTNLIADLLQGVDASRITLQAPGACAVFSDHQYLRIILLNLLSNALKYSAPNSMVAFDIERETYNGRTGLHFRVSNHIGAAGMPDPGQVFTRYYRSEGARRSVGAGLGLWLAQTMARQLGSELHFHADGGSGTPQACFHFRLELT